MRERLYKLAIALGMEPPEEGYGLSVEPGPDRSWWLTGCAGGDCVLPMSRGARTVQDALEHAEGWLAPELEAHNNGENHD